MRNLIRQARQLRGLTQSQLAERVGTTAATVSRLEQDTMTVSTEWLSRFAAALDMHPADLLERPERPSARLLGRAGRDGRIAGGPEEELVADFSGIDGIAVEIGVAQGPYAAGERLIGERLKGASLVSAVGRDCIVGLADGSLMLARVVGTGPRFTLVPPEPHSTIRYDQELSWAAPIAIRIRYTA